MIHRKFSFYFVAAIIFLLSSYQYLRPSQSELFPQSVGTNLYDVRYVKLVGTQEIPLNRFELLGFRENEKTSKSIQTIVGDDDLRYLNEVICSLLGKEIDVRLYARKATVKGWEVTHHGAKNICQMKNEQKVETV